MSINLVFMQIPLVGEISGALQAHPEAQQAYAREHAQEVQKRQQSQVQKLEKQTSSKNVNPDGSQGGQTPHQHQRRKKESQEPMVEDRPLTTKDTPWAGHLLNKRI